MKQKFVTSFVRSVALDRAIKNFYEHIIYMYK